MRHLTSFALVFLALAGLACSGGDDSSTSDSSTSTEPPAYTPDEIQVSYEVMPGAGDFMVMYSDDPYMERAAFTAQLEKDLVPDIFSAVGIDYTELDSDEVPGGYLLDVNPSIQTRAPEDWEATKNAAAALGYVLFQYSVLLTDFTPEDTGNTGYAVVSFPAGKLDDTLAQDFFAHAATVDMGLGGGFFAFGDSMYFLNVTDDEGMPYSGLADDTFVTKLGEAATSFETVTAKLDSSGLCDARFQGNDWDVNAKAGEDYLNELSELDQASRDKLETLQDEFKTLFTTAATQYGW